VDKGKEIRIGSLKNHGPFQDLLDLLEIEAQRLLREVLDGGTDEEILRRQRSALASRNAIDSMVRNVEYFHRIHNLEGTTV
jgi:hypothetical protein